MRIVLDTNVLVSGLLTPSGPPGQIVVLLADGAFELLYDSRIIAEYEAVLARPRFGFDANSIEALIDFIESEGECIAPLPLKVALPDADDLKFLEVAASGGADHLVTGNLRHFPVRQRSNISVLSPAEFLDVLRDRS